MSALRQASFGGGELAPLLRGRSDLAVFGRALRTMRNFFPSKVHGAAVSRPGSLYIGTTRDPEDDSARLIPFVFSDTTSFCIEAGKTNPGGNLYFRFFTDGGQLLSTAAEFAGGPYELLGGLTTADLRLLKWAQTGDILTLTHPAWPALELRRLPDWDVTALNALFTKAKAAGQAAALAYADGNADVQADGFAPMSARALAASSTVDNAIWVLAWYPAFAAAARAAYLAAFRQVWIHDAGVPYAENLANLQGAAAAAAVPAVSSVNAFDTAYANAYSTAFSGLLINSPHWTLTPVVFARPTPYFGGAAGGYPVLEAPVPVADATHPAREWWHACTLTVQDTATGRYYETLPWFVTEYWDKTTVPGNLLPVAFTDHQLVVYPDKPVNVLRGSHLAVSAANLVNLGFREVCMNVYRGRKGLYGLVGNTDSDTFVDVGAEPNWAVQPPLGTHPFLITDFAGGTVLENPAAVAFFQDRRVFLATERRPETLFASATGDYTNFDPHPLLPVAGESLVFDLAARKYERGIHLVSHQKLVIGTRSSVWGFAGAGGAPLDFDSVDARVIDEVGMTDLPPLIIESAIIYARAKGSGVRSLAFEANYGTYSGKDISGQSDHLFVGDSIGFQGARTNRELVDWTYAEDPWGLVWAVRADGALLSLTYHGPEVGWARHDGEPTSGSSGLGPTYRRVCAVPEGSEDAVYVLVTRAIAGTFGVTCVERMTSRVRRGSTEDDACVDCGSRYEGLPVLRITGLDHLFGETVWAVGVGNAPQGPYVVQRDNIGTLMAPKYEYFITLGELPIANSGNFVVLFVGMRYTPDLETLDVVTADSKLKQKTVVKVGFELDQSAGILGGQDFEHLLETRPNTVETGYNAPVPGTQLVELVTERKWDKDARAVLRQSLPLPVTVVGLVRLLEGGE